MTIEEKAKAYDKAIEKIREGIQPLQDGSKISGVTKDFLEEVFPELKESEDERIRKTLIDYFNTCAGDYYGELKLDSIIAWLEKQGKVESDNDDIEVEEKGIREAFNKIEDEKQCKQKPQRMISAEAKEAMYDKLADKVEPKFKVGDWVVYYRNDSSREVLQVYDIRDGRYYFTDNVHFSWSVKECDEKSHLWTIQDAKDGDVLAEDTCTFIIKKLNHDLTAKIYCCLHDDGDFELNSNLGFDDTCTYPATEEQRDLLFTKMKEAGYEWDSEKKELKLLITNGGDFESENCKQKFSWSEEDEKIFNKIIRKLDESDNVSHYDYADFEIWLIDLKERLINI